MKKSFNSNSNLIQKFKNFWCALQLLIVSVSLPVMCFVQFSRDNGKDTNQDIVVNNSVKQNQTAGEQHVVKITRLSKDFSILN
ncbi:MAG: hypothetical protein M3R50_07890 [Bacteroidota bacterium]|nr:hypothetical protein [Bacteroidota bacterium]